MKPFFSILLSIIVLSGCSSYKVVSVKATHIPVDEKADAIQSDAMNRLLEPYRVQVDSIGKQVIGYTDQDLTPGHPESLLYNFFADVMLQYARQHSAKQVDMAVTNPGGLRKPVPKGTITYSTIVELTPFDNDLVVLDLKGADVKALADSIANHRGGPVAGIRFGINNRKAYNIEIQGKPLELDRMYRVAANDYIAKGNDHFAALTKAVGKAEVFETQLQEIIMDYIRQQTAEGKIIHITLDGRLYYEDK